MPIGDKFDKLEVVSAPYLKLMGNHRRRRWVKVRCDCGKTTEALEYNLRVGRIRSCGCAQGAPRALVIIGERFGRLVVIGEPYLKPVGGRRRSHVLVRCDCGTETEAGVTNLRRGNTQSCGCMVREATIARSTTHGATATRLYRIWRGMHKRCSNPNADSYKWYGAKGIKVCPEWSSFEVFREWALPNGYAEGLELDRENSDEDYCPRNCRWITKKANIRRIGLFWSNELDARLVQYASATGVNPYDVIRLSVEEYLLPRAEPGPT
jgi:hypothetical protein